MDDEMVDECLRYNIPWNPRDEYCDQVAALRAQVIRLEEELTELKKAGKILVKDNDRIFAECKHLEAAIEAKDAALRAWDAYREVDTSGSRADRNEAFGKATSLTRTALDALGGE